jgi:oligoribonuclease
MVKYKERLWLFLDLETTGLEPESGRDVILEVSAMVVDPGFNILAQYQAVVNQPDSYLLGMDNWCKQTHSESGLVTEVRNSQKTEQRVEQELCEFLSKHLTEVGRLTGNSIHFDRRFIRKYWPQLNKMLNYRMVDASAFLEAFYVAFGWDGEHDRRAVAHRAVPDTLDSIDFLKKMLSVVDVEKLLANDFTMKTKA